MAPNDEPSYICGVWVAKSGVNQGVAGPGWMWRRASQGSGLVMKLCAGGRIAVGSWRHLTVGVAFREYVREFFRCRVLRPLLRQLRGGVTPRRLAWSVALGVVIGINPSIGLATLAVALIAWTCGLNQIASQVGLHAVAPLHLLLFVPFIEVGVYLFHTRRLPLTRKQIEHLGHHPLRLFHAIWQWEWHALVVWGVVAAVTMPLLAMYLRRVLVLLMRRNRGLMRPQTPLD